MELALAVPPNTDAAFLREVDEELRRDELAKAWRRYGVSAVIALVVALAAFGGWLLWRQHQHTLAGEHGEALTKAYDDIVGGQSAAAGRALADIGTSRVDAYRALARFTEADLLVKKNDLKGAAAKFAGVAGDTSVSQPFRDLALIRQTSAEYDTLKPEVVVSRLRGLAVPGNPWLGSAGELAATAYLRMNRRDLAGKLYAQMAKDENVPASLRQRAVQMAGVLGVDAVDQGEEKKAT